MGGSGDGVSGAAELREQSAEAAKHARELHTSALAFLSHNRTEEQAICERAAELDSEIWSFRSKVDAALKSGKIDRDEAERINEEIYKTKSLIADGYASLIFPAKPHGRFIRMFVGPVNVRASRKDVQFNVKEEYNSFRDRTAFLFLVFPLTLLLLRSYIWNGCFPVLPVQLYQAWLLYLYTSLALRENILRVNGSDIRPWWICHHYCAMAMALVSLTWEIERGHDCPHKQKGVELFLLWAIMQGFAMLLQNRYQRQRLYTRIALGKAKRMDVVWGETAAVEGQLWLLCPLLFTLQGFEAYIGIALLRTAFAGVLCEWQMMNDFIGWQVVVCGLLLVVMALGNFVNTVETLMAKSRFKAKIKRSKSKQEMANGSVNNLRSLKSL